MSGKKPMTKAQIVTALQRQIEIVLGGI